MTTILKKSLISILAVGLLGGFTLPFINANANSNPEKPKIRRVENVKGNSAVLQLRWGEYKNKDNVDVKVRVRIRDMATGAVRVQQFDTRINGNGNGRVVVTGLKPNTPYEFKVKIRKITLKDFSDYSSRKTATTTKAAVMRSSSASESTESVSTQQQEEGVNSSQ